MASEVRVQMKHITSILDTLAQLMIPGFGPNSLNTMLVTSAGKVVVTSDAGSVLQSLHLSHPLGRTVVGAVRDHVAVVGDGGKSFLLILAKVFSELEKRLNSNRNDKQLKLDVANGFCELRNRIPQIVHCLAEQLCQVDTSSVVAVQKEFRILVQTMLQGKFPLTTVSHLTDMIIDFLFCGVSKVSELMLIIADCLKNFEVLYLESVGHPITMSRTLPGFVIQRDFHSLHPDLSIVEGQKVVIFGCVMHGDDEDSHRASYSILPLFHDSLFRDFGYNAMAPWLPFFSRWVKSDVRQKPPSDYTRERPDITITPHAN